MKTRPSFRRAGRPGFISYVLVLSTGIMLTLLMIFAYRNASSAMDTQARVQLRTDQLNKEDAVLRSIVAITPNRAILAMQTNSNSNGVRERYAWQQIFTDALDQANARNSISALVAGNLSLGTTYKGNAGDSTLTNVSIIFDAVEPESGFVASGLNRSLGNGFPIPLNCADATLVSRDKTYPIISTKKVYGALAEGKVGLSTASYPLYNKIPYPQINFGYARPGELFVAKRNWWAFSINIAQNDAEAMGITSGARWVDKERDYVLSIYEIPSQLAVSANAFTALGKHASGDEWQNVTIQGDVFTGKALLEGSTNLPGLSSRRGLTMGGNNTIGGQSFQGSPLAAGVREQYEVTSGQFFPISLPSESGRAAFVPINRGKQFFDRFALTPETNTLSASSDPASDPTATTWDMYSVGALQCAMQLDVMETISINDQTPVKLRFRCKKGGAIYSDTLTVNSSAWETDSPPKPFNVVVLPGSRPCVVIKPQLFPAYLASIGVDGVAINNSICVNADYKTGVKVRTPIVPCLESDIGLVMTNCSDLTAYTKGFSVVTNFRLYIGDDFNIVATTPPAGSGIPSPYYPPASLYAPERRYGTDVDPWKIELGGQVGSLASDSAATPIHPLDMKMSSGATMAADKITVNLRPITHPAALPPVTMMNWLIVLEERRQEFW